MISRGLIYYWWVKEYGQYGFSDEELRQAYIKVNDEALAWAFGLTWLRKGWFA